jgi:hypothetical protein
MVASSCEEPAPRNQSFYNCRHFAIKNMALEAHGGSHYLGGPLPLADLVEAA